MSKDVIATIELMESILPTNILVEDEVDAHCWQGVLLVFQILLSRFAPGYFYE